MSEPIRILHCFGRMDRGGAETFIMNVYRNVNRNKVQFDFLVHTQTKCDYDDEIIELGGRIYRVPRYNIRNHYTYKREWKNLLSKHGRQWEFIHSHMTSTASIYLKIAKKYKIKTITHSHSTSPGFGIEAFIKDLMQKPLKCISDYLFACSSAAGSSLFGEYTKRDNYFILNNAIDIDKFIFNRDIRDNKRKELKIDGKFVIGHVGSMYEVKNHTFIVDIFNEILKHNSNIVLLLVGDGTLRKSIEDKVLNLGLEEYVIFTGVRSDVPELLNTMDVLLFPSLYEGLPVTLIEAQASGLKCIISDSITKEVKITDNIEFVSLDQSIEYWSEQVMKYQDGYDRLNTYKEVSNYGYCIKENSKWLEHFYLEKQ